MSGTIHAREGKKRIMNGSHGNIRSALIEMRSYPYVIGTYDGDKMNVDDALVTIVDPGSNPLYQRGMVIQVRRSEMTANKLNVRPVKYLGSNNHHKFTVIAHGLSFNSRQGGWAL